MEVYTILLYLLLLLSIIEAFSSREISVGLLFKSSKCSVSISVIAAFFVACTLIIISGLRDITIGRDLINYIPRYARLGSCSWSELFSISRMYSFEYGFSVFCKILYMLNPSFDFFLIVTSFIVGCGFYRLSMYSKMPMLTFFIIYSFGIFGSSMNVIRQFLSISILIFGIKYCIERRLCKFIIIITIAILFHSGSILFLLLYFMFNIKFDNRSFITFILACIFIALIGDRLIYMIISKTSFAWYLAGIWQGSGTSTFIFLFFILLTSYLFREKIYRIDINSNLWIWGLGMAVLFNSLAFTLGIFARAMKFFLPFMAILIPDILFSLKSNKLLYIISIIIVLIFFVLYFYFIVLEKTAVPEGWYPYIIR